MDKAGIELEARLMAIEHALSQAVAIQHVHSGHSTDLVTALHKMQLEQVRQETFPNGEPAKSDYAAGEFEIAVERLQTLIFEKLKVLLSR